MKFLENFILKTILMMYDFFPNYHKILISIANFNFYFKKFFEFFNSVPQRSSAREVKIAAEKINSNVKWFDRNYENISIWLKNSIYNIFQSKSYFNNVYLNNLNFISYFNY
jgi:hypothetical protein